MSPGSIRVAYSAQIKLALSKGLTPHVARFSLPSLIHRSRPTSFSPMKFLYTLVLVSLLSYNVSHAACGPQQGTRPASCVEDLCIGDEAYYLGYSSGPIKGPINSVDGLYVIARLLVDGKYKNIRATPQNFIKASMTAGSKQVCTDSFCTGDQVIFHGTGGDDAIVLGASPRGYLVYELLSGRSRGKIGHAFQRNFSCNQ
jgi:hypothetical protein